MHRLSTITLAALVSCLAVPANAQPAAQTITVSSFSFAPKPIHLTAGGAPGGEIELRGHQTRSITLVPARGTYTAHCSHFMHTQMGMSDQIVVD
jgi:hypothetical protein